jgi:hypothetical protein
MTPRELAQKFRQTADLLDELFDVQLMIGAAPTKLPENHEITKKRRALKKKSGAKSKPDTSNDVATANIKPTVAEFAAMALKEVGKPLAIGDLVTGMVSLGWKTKSKKLSAKKSTVANIVASPAGKKAGIRRGDEAGTYELQS